MDICRLILDDHAEQRKLFALIEDVDRKDTAALSAIWTRLANFLETHAEAEERFFYPSVVRKGKGAGDADDMEEEVEDAIEDHNKIRDAVAAVAKEKVGSDAWFEAIAKANEENGDHMAEEERQGMTDMRRQLNLEERHALGVKFAAFDAKNVTGVKPVDKDPEGYIEEHKAG